MNASLTTKKQKFSKLFMLFTAAWCSTIMPAIPSYAKIQATHELPDLNSQPTEPEDKLARSLAQTSKTAAIYLAEKKNAKEITELAQNYSYNRAISVSIEEITRWLSKAGNSKLSLKLDKNLSLKNAQFDWLIPWYEQANTLLFTQHSIHHTDNRLQTNHGIGARYFTNNNMIGVNTFFDHDLSHYHSRVGLGAEYGQDYIKLSTNAYLPITSWRSAPELGHKYDARPARGWDIQAEGWLPMYPNFGGNIKFEQYFGHDVALMGKNNRQRNPSATTLGLNWTPIPLVTLSTDHKMSAKFNETSAKVQFTWAFDKRFAEQIDPSRVGETRLLSGNRHDFVKRNNNIVLEYQQEKTLQLTLPQTIRGGSGQQFKLVKSLTSEFPLKKIVWHAPELLAAGGTISSTDQNAMVMLPAYKAISTPQNQSINRYNISGVAYDVKGNASPSITTTVEVFDVNALFIQSNKKVPQGNLLANGKDINRFSIIVKNASGQPVANTKVTFTLPTELQLSTKKTATTPSVSKSTFLKKMQPMKMGKYWKYEANTNALGEAEVQFTTLTAGTHQITAETHTGQTFSQLINFKLDVHQSSINNLTVIKSGAIADGKSQNIVKVYVTDGKGKPIANETVHFDAINGKMTAEGVTNKDGVIEVPITSTHVGNVTVIAKLNGETKTTSVEFVNNLPAKIEIVNIHNAVSGTETPIELKLIDKSGAPFTVPNQYITVMASIGNSQFPILVHETGTNTGKYAGELPAQTGGNYNLIVSYNNIVSPKQSYSVFQLQNMTALNPDGSGPKGQQGVVDKITISTDSTSNLNVGNDLKVFINVKDAFGHDLDSIDGQKITLHASNKRFTGWADDTLGDYYIYLPLEQSGQIDISATINGISSPKITIQVKP